MCGFAQKWFQNSIAQQHSYVARSMLKTIKLFSGAAHPSSKQFLS